MNFLSGVKSKSVLGRKLSNRYLSRDAFTSTNRAGGRGVRRLGSVFKTRRSLFEVKFTVMKVLLLVFVFILLIYTIPTFRYMIHGQLVQYMLTDDQKAVYAEKREGEFFVAPKYGATDAFIMKVDEASVYEGNDIVSDALEDYPVGSLVKDGDSVYIKLFSDPEFKNNFFIKVKEKTQKSIVAETENASSSPATTTEVVQVEHTSFQSTVFTGSGYGELVAKLPPQEGNIKEGDLVYVQTTQGLKPFAVVSRITDENSSGSTFTFVYAQLLVSPQKLYKVKVLGQK